MTQRAGWRVGQIYGLTGAVLALLVAIVVTFAQRPGPGAPADRAGAARTPVATSPAPPRTALPDGPEGEPRTIPAVRSFDAEPGPGWAPSGTTRVTADPDGPLDDEADLLARELDLDRGPGPAGPGDVALVVRRGAGTGPEGYRLVTRDHQVTITGATDTGVFYGTRTLLQSVRGADGLPEGVVDDRPDRPQRGLLVDVARKHFSADWLAARLREMADLKLNQLHLHLSDDQGFRIESESHPEVVSTPHLTKAEVRDLVELAAARHITVIPEIDSPGHLGAVLAAHPELQLRDATGTPTAGAIDIADPRSAALVDDLLREYAPLFPGRYVHLGGDEYAALFRSDPEAAYPGLARAARERHGPGADVQDLATSWLNDRAEVVRGLGRTPQVWNDGMHAGGVVVPDQRREVTYWTGRELGAREPAEYLEGGWQLINMSSEYLYYVLGEPNQFFYPTGERIYAEWDAAVLRGSRRVPERFAGPDHVLGGRFAVWCDLAGAQTPRQVAEGIRMPLRAAAQKLWDPAEPELSWADFTDLADRVEPG